MSRFPSPPPRTAGILRAKWIVCIATSALACGSSVEVPLGPSTAGGASTTTGGHGGAGATASTGATGAGAGQAGSVPTGGSAGAPLPTTLCNLTPCQPGEECCLTTGSCFDPIGAPEACPVPTQPGPFGEDPCGASSQCGPDRFCMPENPFICLGAGYCELTGMCQSGLARCGCDGTTWTDGCAALLSGVYAHGDLAYGDVACGETTLVGGSATYPGKEVIYCGADEQCPAPLACCGITGQCYDPAVPVLCSFPPEGASLPCIVDSDCLLGPSEFCNGEGCEGPGGCFLRPSACSGEVAWVCGCDGSTYLNHECAAMAGVRVTHDGECP